MEDGIAGKTCAVRSPVTPFQIGRQSVATYNGVQPSRGVELEPIP